MSRAKKADQAVIDRLCRLLLQKVADFQVTGKPLLFRAPAWSCPDDIARSRNCGPYQFSLVPDYLVLIELTLSDPTALPQLHHALKRLKSHGDLHRMPLRYADHQDLAYKRVTGEIVLVRVSPEDGETTVDLYGTWPLPSEDGRLGRYVFPVKEDGETLGIGYRITEAGIDSLSPAQSAPAPAAQTQVSPGGTLTAKQVADKYGVDLDKVYGWIKSGLLTAVDVSTRVGARRKRYAIRQQDLDAFEHRMAVRPPQTPPRRRRRDPAIKEFI